MNYAQSMLDKNIYQSTRLTEVTIPGNWMNYYCIHATFWTLNFVVFKMPRDVFISCPLHLGSFIAEYIQDAVYVIARVSRGEWDRIGPALSEQTRRRNSERVARELIRRATNCLMLARKLQCNLDLLCSEKETVAKILTELEERHPEE